jgi:hypothetical protein
MPSQPRTYSTKFDPGPAVAESLADYAKVFSKAMRTAYRALESAARTGQPLGQAPHKLDLAHRFGLTSRQAGSVLVEASASRPGPERRTAQVHHRQGRGPGQG